MNKIYILLLLSLVALISRAESNKGLTDTDNYVEKRTTTLFDDFWYKTRQYGLCAEPDDPYAALNTMIVGTWYENQSLKITFNADGTTDYGTGYTYKFFPLQGTILMYNSDGSIASQVYVMKMSGDTMILRESGSNEMKVYTNFFPPVKHVTAITNVPDEVEITFRMNGSTATYSRLKITPTVIPQNADNRELIWTSTDEKIVKVHKGANGSYELSPELTYGTAYVTGTAADGSGVSVTCKVVSTRWSVDLGLSVNWATMNIGASESWLPGDEFAWGETEPKEEYTWETYKWAEGTTDDDPKLIKYCDDFSATRGWGIIADNKNTLDLEDDAAHVLWGSEWRMPTYEEIEELIENCTYNLSVYKVFTDESGEKHEVLEMTSKINGNSIYLPVLPRTHDFFWSSSKNLFLVSTYAQTFGYNTYYTNLDHKSARKVYAGLPIRPVRPNPNYKK